MAIEKKFLDYEGLKYLWSKINMNDYPNNEFLMEVIEAIDETKADKEYVDSKIFIGTKLEYNAAYAAGNIAVGTLVCITDDNEDDGEMSFSTTAALGTALLGSMILGVS